MRPLLFVAGDKAECEKNKDKKMYLTLTHYTRALPQRIPTLLNVHSTCLLYHSLTTTPLCSVLGVAHYVSNDMHQIVIVLRKSVNLQSGG
jgi:hypothetical protein